MGPKYKKTNIFYRIRILILKVYIKKPSIIQMYLSFLTG